MVTTINPESAGLASENLDFTLDDLQESELPEEQKLFQLAVSVLQDLLEKLKPIAKYITVPTKTVDDTLNHIVFVAMLDEPYSKDGLYLNSKGEFVGGRIEEAVFTKIWEGGTHAEWFVKLDDLFKGLLELLTTAVKRREQHLAAIEKKRKLLEEISCLIHMKEKSD